MGKEEEGSKATLIFFKPSFSVSGGSLSLSLSVYALLPQPLLSHGSKNSHEHRVWLSALAGFLFVCFFHTSFTSCCSDYTMQHITSVERKDKGRVCPREGLAILTTTKHPMLSAHTVSANKGKNTLESRTFFSS